MIHIRPGKLSTHNRKKTSGASSVNPCIEKKEEQEIKNARKEDIDKTLFTFGFETIGTNRIQEVHM